MKQQITKEQWNEITDKQIEEFLKKVPSIMDRRGAAFFIDMPNIGQMIEFLGNDNDRWVEQCNAFRLGCSQCICEVDELCDYLWEAIKYKLCQ